MATTMYIGSKDVEFASHDTINVLKCLLNYHVPKEERKLRKGRNGFKVKYNRIVEMLYHIKEIDMSTDSRMMFLRSNSEWFQNCKWLESDDSRLSSILEDLYDTLLDVMLDQLLEGKKRIRFVFV